MNSRVLVLNQDFSPLMVCSIERAFILVYLRKSEMVKSANGHQLRTVTKSFPRPSVIRLNKYVNAPYQGVNLTRQNIFKRDHFTCQYCGTKRDLTIDHVLPKVKGGSDTWTNLVTACKKCNARKGESTPDEANMPLAHKPYKPSYAIFLNDHMNGQSEEWALYLQGHGY